MNELLQFAQLVSAGGLIVAACGATYWGGRISQGMKQLQSVAQDHEERLRNGGL